MKLPRGARSIRGALGAYVWASVALVVALALVLVLGPDGVPRGTRVVLDDDGAGVGATLDAAHLATPLELHPGESLVVPPGTYRLRLFADDGAFVERELEIAGDVQHLLGTDATDAR